MSSPRTNVMTDNQWMLLAVVMIVLSMSAGLFLGALFHTEYQDVYNTPSVKVEQLNKALKSCDSVTVEYKIKPYLPAEVIGGNCK